MSLARFRLERELMRARFASSARAKTARAARAGAETASAVGTRTRVARAFTTAHGARCAREGARGMARVDSTRARASSSSSEALEWPSRDRLAGTLRDGDVGAEATLCGWIDKSRDMGGIAFADVRDHSGIAQIVADEDASAEVRETFGNLRQECVVRARGTVRARKSVNKKTKTGTVELVVTELKILNSVGKSLPFAVSESSGEKEEIKEETRLEHRVLDLRRPQMATNFKLCLDTLRALRQVMEDDYGLFEVDPLSLS